MFGFGNRSDRRRHLVITGTGRAGTTFLVQLLGRLGLDIGFTDPAHEIALHCNAGLEWNLSDPNAPYVVKNPRLCDELDTALAAGGVAIDHVLIPIRDLHAAAESRRDVVRRVGAAPGERVIGGVWPGSDAARQEEFLALKLYSLMRTISRYDLPHTLLEFPRLVSDGRYLFDKLWPVLRRAHRRVGRREFLRVFTAVSRPALVHEFADARR